MKIINFIKVLLCTVIVIFPVIGEEESILTRFEKAQYYEETEGDIEKVITLYREIVRDGQDAPATSAQAQYRIGLCYLKMGDKKNAESELRKVLSLYEELPEIVNLARQRLSGLHPDFSPGHSPLKLDSAPWDESEFTVHTIFGQTGIQTGIQISEIASDGNSWIMESYQIIPAGSPLSYTRCVVEKKSFLPQSSLFRSIPVYKMSAREISAEYREGKAIIKNVSVENSVESTVKLEGSVFDDAQVMYLVRKLPLQEGFEDSTLVFSIYGGYAAKGVCKVIGTEQVTTKAGTFKCYKTLIQTWAQGKKEYDETFWIEAEGKRAIVKMSITNGMTELTNYGSGVRTEFTAIRDQNNGATLKLPAGYYHYAWQPSGSGPLLYLLFSPSMDAEVALAVTKAEIGADERETVIKKEIKVLKEFFKKYKLRPDSRETTDIKGIARVSFSADYMDEKIPMVEYRSYYFGPSRLYWFIFRCSRENFDKKKTEFERIVNSLEISQVHDGK
jgi:hypothetical protein